MKTEVVSPTKITQKRKKQSVDGKEVTKQKGTNVATKDDDEEEVEEEEEEFTPGEDEVKI